MEYRGHILIVFALSLILSPIAIKIATSRGDQPDAVQTVGSAVQACINKGVDTAAGRLGCDVNATRQDSRRLTMASSDRRHVHTSGAAFVSARTSR